MKICTKCGIEKPFEAFWRSKNRPDGYVSSCAECNNKKVRDYYKKNKEKKREKNRKYRLKKKLEKAKNEDL